MNLIDHGEQRSIRILEINKAAATAITRRHGLAAKEEERRKKKNLNLQEEKDDSDAIRTDE